MTETMIPPAELHFAGRLTIERVWTLKKELLAALLAHRAVVIHLEQAEEFDLAFLQMLCAARKLARDRGKELSLGRLPQTTLREAVCRYGFDDLLRCREACGSCLWL